jgi:hypothetical protein
MIPDNPDRMVPEELRRQLRLPRVGQLGYVVGDVREAVNRHRDALGIRPWLVLDESHPITLRGVPGRCTLRLGMAYSGAVQVELIQVLEGASIHTEATQQPEGTLHHLGFMVQGIRGRLDECRRRGIGILQSGTIAEAGITTEYAYLDTVARAGVVLELIQWRLGPLPFPSNRITFNAVCGIGAWTAFRGRVVR